MREISLRQRLARNIVAKINAENPELAKHVAAAMSPPSSMAGILDNIGDAFTGALTGYTQIALDKERAKVDAKRAKEIAQNEAALMGQQIQMQMIRAETEARRNELMAEQFELQKFIKEIELQKWQKVGLYLAGGLTIFLVATRLKG